MSILSALKSKGAKGKNIEEAVKTLPVGGGVDGVTRIYLGKVQAYAQADKISQTGINFAKSEDDPTQVTLGELIGDKTIIGFEMCVDDPRYIPDIIGAWGGGQSGAYNILARQNEEGKDQIGMSIHFYTNLDMSNQGSGTWVKVYAVCI